MSRLLIDTDTAADDPVGLVMALGHQGVRVEAITVVAVEMGGEWCRGQTIVDHPETAIAGGYQPNVEVVEEASRERLLHMLYEAVRV